MLRMAVVLSVLLTALGVPVVSTAAECYTQTVSFNPNQGYSWNTVWGHCLADIPSGCSVESAEIEVRAQVWYWGWYPFEQDILISNTTEFKYSEGYVCSLTTSTHPSTSNFYTIFCDLDSSQTPWALDDGCANFNMVTFGGTYYMDYAKLTVCCGEAGPPVIDAISYDSCIGEEGIARIEVTASDPAGGNLSYAWDALDGGTIIDSGSTVSFTPPGASVSPACDSYNVQVTVTSDAGNQLATQETIGITVKLAGDVNGDGIVNIVDKVLVRNAFGSTGEVDEDVNCDGVVNIVDKVIVRNQFGSNGCGCP
jgi:hypothetical protein